MLRPEIVILCRKARREFPLFSGRFARSGRDPTDRPARAGGSRAAPTFVK